MTEAFSVWLAVLTGACSETVDENLSTSVKPTLNYRKITAGLLMIQIAGRERRSARQALAFHASRS